MAKVSYFLPRYFVLLLIVEDVPVGCELEVVSLAVVGRLSDLQGEIPDGNVSVGVLRLRSRSLLLLVFDNLPTLDVGFNLTAELLGVERVREVVVHIK